MQTRRTKRWRAIAAVFIVIAGLGLVSGCPDGTLLDRGGEVQDDPNGTNGETEEPETYTVTYDGTGADSGTVPVDPNSYESGEEVSVAGNTGGLEREGFAFAGWNTQADGTGTTYGEGDAFTMGTADVTLYVRWDEIQYQIGGVGPAGGFIFYDHLDDQGSLHPDGWRYLEAAPVGTEWTEKLWGGHGTAIGLTAQETAIGSGAANTTAIVAALGVGDYAARLCADLEYGGYDDWFLPSKNEVEAMYENLHDRPDPIGGFASKAYWSSSEDSGANSEVAAWGQNFTNGYQGTYNKSNSEVITRAIRAF